MPMSKVILTLPHNAGKHLETPDNGFVWECLEKNVPNIIFFWTNVSNTDVKRLNFDTFSSRQLFL